MGVDTFTRIGTIVLCYVAQLADWRIFIRDVIQGKVEYDNLSNANYEAYY